MLIVLATGAWVAPAQADGDPASDVLATQALFLPQDAGVTPRQEIQLQRLLGEAAATGYPIRLALVASPSDLGSISGLWDQPASYARFLGQELSDTYHGTLLVIMPAGFGVLAQGRSGAVAESALRGVPSHRPGPGFAAAALAAVRRLAAVAGHTLPVPRVATPASRGAGDPLPWLIFAAGLVVIGVAWGASLRARPLSGAPEVHGRGDPAV